MKLCEEYGSYYLTDYAGNVKACIGDIIIFTADEANNTMGRMTYQVVKPYYEYKMTIHIDADYLKDEKTVYPIRIDPTVEINYGNNGAGAIEDVTINSTSTYSGTSGSLYVGKHSNGSVSRILMRFPNLDMPVPFAPMILSAKVEVRDLMCQDDEAMTISCYKYNNSLSAWSESSPPTWSSVASSCRSTFLDSMTVSYGKGNVEKHRYAFDITALAKEWADGIASPEKGIVLSSTVVHEKGTNYWYKTFASYNRSAYKPSLSIQYETKMVCTMRDGISGNRYLKVDGSNINKVQFSDEYVENTGYYLWCIQYYPQYNSFNIVAMGVRCNSGKNAYALYYSGGSVGMMQQNTSYPYIRFKPIKYAGDVYYWQNTITGSYLAINETTSQLSASTSKSAETRMYVDRIDTASFNNFFNGTYSKGIYDGVAHIKLVIGNSWKSHELFKDNDVSAALLWNGITDNIIIYGPNDTVPAGITPLYVTFETCDLGGDFGHTIPNGYTYEDYDNLSVSKKIEIMASDWNSVKIYLNNEATEIVFSDISQNQDRIELMINKTIIHEVGHALKLAHLDDSTNQHHFSGAIGEYSLA